MTEALRSFRGKDGRTYVVANDGHYYVQHPISGIWKDCGMYESPHRASQHAVTRKTANNSILLLLGGLIAAVSGVGFYQWTKESPDSAIAAKDDGRGIPKEVTRWRPLVEKYTQKRDLPADLVEVMIWYESGGDPTKISLSGAVGLMQVVPSDGKGVTFTDRKKTAELLDPETNIKEGCRILREKTDQFGSLYDGIKYYGPDPAYLKSKPEYNYDEDYYVKKVLRIWERYHPNSYFWAKIQYGF